MNLTTLIAEAFHSLGKNKVRTTLSVLGIVIGVGAVIAMVAVASGAQRKVEREIAAMGDDWLTIWYTGVTRGGAHREQATPPNQSKEDAEAIAAECSGVRAASPTNRVGAQVVSQYGNYRTGVMGVYPNFFDIRRWNAVEGRVIDADDMQIQAKVCCLGTTVVRELFGSVEPLGGEIRVNNRNSFKVVGVLEPKGVGSDGRDFDDVILFPFTSFQRLIAGNEPSGTLFAAAKPGVPLATAKEQIRQVLRRRHRLADEDEDSFRIMDRSLMAQANAEATATFNTLLTSIASISLLVGGVGIMNIMLVSVTERTREIGLRMAIGANSSHVLGQFLCEALVLCLIGGLLGFGAGCATAEWVASFYGWEIEISYWMAAVAVAFASAVGIFFGFYPAWRASRLDPIYALRFE
jgi:putative ABC transport system permease protein